MRPRYELAADNYRSYCETRYNKREIWIEQSYFFLFSLRLVVGLVVLLSITALILAGLKSCTCLGHVCTLHTEQWRNDAFYFPSQMRYREAFFGFSFPSARSSSIFNFVSKVLFSRRRSRSGWWQQIERRKLFRGKVVDDDDRAAVRPLLRHFTQRPSDRKKNVFRGGEVVCWCTRPTWNDSRFTIRAAQHSFFCGG